MTHRELCKIAARYLRNEGIHRYHRCQYVVCELERAGESPDAFGFGGSTTQLIEVKVSRSDFFSDKNKFWRKFPKKGIGGYRSYLCPEGLIKVNEVPENWGLLYVLKDMIVFNVINPKIQECNRIEEINLISSILRREGIRPKIFSYKKYASEINDIKEILF